MALEGTNLLEVISCSVDYVTATITSGVRAQVLLTAVLHWLALSELEGSSRKPWSWNGYQGENTESMTYGQREDGAIVRLSGESARAHTPTLLSWADSISRLDVQVTLLDRNPKRDWAELLLYDVAEDPRVKSGKTRTTKLTSTPSGSTAYIGTRISDRYFRVYNKYAEAGDPWPPGSWRWEIEYKHERARKVADRLIQGNFSSDTVRAVVGAGFADYGHSLPCDVLPITWRDSGIRLKSTDARRLQWLSTSIKPLVLRLRESYGTDTILGALGLGRPTSELVEQLLEQRSAKKEDDGGK